MKSILCLSVAALMLVAVSGVSSKLTVTGNSRRVARGFRLGAADRFSHGFGKRTDDHLPEVIPGAESDVLLSNAEFAELLRSDEKLANLIVQDFVDKNGDGFITRNELMGYRK